MADIYCDANLATGANDGSSWENAYQGASAIATAFNRSSNGDRIMVKAGDYRNAGFRTTKSLSIVAVDGPFLTSMTITGNPAGGYWFYQTDSNNTVIDGFAYRVAAGQSNNYEMFYGSGIKVRNCIFAGLKQKNFGAYSTFVNCLFSGCTLSSIFGWRQNAYSCTFSGNSGGIGTPLYIANCIFAGNSNNSVVVHSSGWCRNTFAASVPSGSTGCVIGTDAKIDSGGKLLAGSPCIGAGSASYLQTAADLAGTPWLDPPSIGCYEFIKGGGRRTLSPNDLHPFGGSWKR